MSYRPKYQVSGYRSLPSSNRSSLYFPTDYSSSKSNITEDLSDFDRQFKKLLERTEKFTNRVEKLQSTSAYIKKGFRKIDTTVTGSRYQRDILDNTYDSIENRLDSDGQFPSTEEEWRRLVDIGMLIEKAVEILRHRYRCPKAVFEYSPASRSPYSINITPRPLVTPPKSPKDREGNRIRDLGCELQYKVSDDKNNNNTVDKRKSPLLSKRKLDKFETKLGALTEIEEPKSPTDKNSNGTYETDSYASNRGNPTYSTRNGVNTNFSSSKIFDESSNTPTKKSNIEDEFENTEGVSKGKRKSFLETLKNAASKRIGRSSDTKDQKGEKTEKSGRRSRPLSIIDSKQTSTSYDNLANRTDRPERTTSRNIEYSRNSSLKKTSSIDRDIISKNLSSSYQKKSDEESPRIKKIGSSSSFHEYNPSSRIPLKERLRLKELERIKQEESVKNTRERYQRKKELNIEVGGVDSRSSDSRSSSSISITNRRRTREKSDSPKKEEFKPASNSSNNDILRSPKINSIKNDKKSDSSDVLSSTDDDMFSYERTPLRERRKSKPKTDESDLEGDIVSSSYRKTSTDSMLSRRFSVEDTDTPKSPSQVLRSVRMNKEASMDSTFTNKIQMAKQRISKTNEILSSVKDGIDNDEIKQKKHSSDLTVRILRNEEERKQREKERLEREKPYIYTDEQPVSESINKKEVDSSSAMRMLQQMAIVVEEDNIVQTKMKKERYSIEFVTPQSSIDEIEDIEGKISTPDQLTDNFVSDNIFDALNKIESPKYPSEEEIAVIKIESPIKVDDNLFERVYKQVEEDEQNEKHTIEKHENKNEVEVSDIPVSESREQFSELPNTYDLEGTVESTNNEAICKIDPVEKALPEKSNENKVKIETATTQIPIETHVEPDITPETPSRKKSATLSINLNSPALTSKSLSTDLADEIAKADEILNTIANAQTTSIKENITSETPSITAEEVSSDNTQTKPESPIVRKKSTTLSINLSIDKDIVNEEPSNKVQTDKEVDMISNNNIFLTESKNIQNETIANEKHTDNNNNTDPSSNEENSVEQMSKENNEIIRPHSSVDLLLEELDGMNIEFSEDNNKMHISRTKSLDRPKSTSDDYTIKVSPLENPFNLSLVDLTTSPKLNLVDNKNTSINESEEKLDANNEPLPPKSLFKISKILSNKDINLQTFAKYCGKSIDEITGDNLKSKEELENEKEQNEIDANKSEPIGKTEDKVENGSENKSISDINNNDKINVIKESNDLVPTISKLENSINEKSTNIEDCISVELSDKELESTVTKTIASDAISDMSIIQACQLVSTSTPTFNTVPGVILLNEQSEQRPRSSSSTARLDSSGQETRIKMGYREKREAHLRMLQSKSNLHGSVTSLLEKEDESKVEAIKIRDSQDFGSLNILLEGTVMEEDINETLVANKTDTTTNFNMKESNFENIDDSFTVQNTNESTINNILEVPLTETVIPDNHEAKAELIFDEISSNLTESTISNSVNKKADQIVNTLEKNISIVTIQENNDEVFSVDSEIQPFNTNDNHRPSKHRSTVSSKFSSDEDINSNERPMLVSQMSIKEYRQKKLTRQGTSETSETSDEEINNLPKNVDDADVSDISSENNERTKRYSHSRKDLTSPISPGWSSSENEAYTNFNKSNKAKLTKTLSLVGKVSGSISEPIESYKLNYKTNDRDYVIKTNTYSGKDRRTYFAASKGTKSLDQY